MKVWIRKPIENPVITPWLFIEAIELGKALECAEYRIAGILHMPGDEPDWAEISRRMLARLETV